MAATRKEVEAAFDGFLEDYRSKYPTAADFSVKDRDQLLAYYDFPAEHCAHLRTTNPIESTFTIVRLWHRPTRGNGSRTACLAMIFKLVQSATKNRRLPNGSELLSDVIREIGFQNGFCISQAAAKFMNSHPQHLMPTRPTQSLYGSRPCGFPQILSFIVRRCSKTHTLPSLS